MPLTRKTGEVHFSTEEQVIDYARAAVSICDELNLSPEERVALLPAILDKLSAKQVFMEQVQVDPLGVVTPNNRR